MGVLGLVIALLLRTRAARVTAFALVMLSYSHRKEGPKAIAPVSLRPSYPQGWPRSS